MTVGTQMEQCIASVQSATASLKTFALETQDQQAKQTFQQLVQTMEGVVQTLKERQQYVKEQEPQFR